CSDEDGGHHLCGPVCRGDVPGRGLLRDCRTDRAVREIIDTGAEYAGAGGASGDDTGISDMSAAGKIRLAAAAAALCAALLMPVKISAQSLSAETESTREEMEDITEQTGEDLLARMDLEAVEEAVDEL